jgi:hypothetical protein
MVRNLTRILYLSIDQGDLVSYGRPPRRAAIRLPFKHYTFRMFVKYALKPFQLWRLYSMTASFVRTTNYRSEPMAQRRVGPIFNACELLARS